MREQSEISPVNKGLMWGFFRVAWDTKMAEMHNEKWTQLFADVFQNVLEKLETEETQCPFSIHV